MKTDVISIKPDQPIMTKTGKEAAELDRQGKPGRKCEGTIYHDTGSKGWKNVISHRPKTRPDTAGRCRKQVVAVMDDGSWLVFPYVGAAAKWLGDGNRENIGRCCRCNQSKAELRKPWGHPSGKVNTDHRYQGIRWYFESDNIWTTKIV